MALAVAGLLFFLLGLVVAGGEIDKRFPATNAVVAAMCILVAVAVYRALFAETTDASSRR